MLNENPKRPGIQPVFGNNGEPVPGLFHFERLTRDIKIELDIAEFILEEERQRKLQKIEESLKS